LAKGQNGGSVRRTDLQKRGVCCSVDMKMLKGEMEIWIEMMLEGFGLKSRELVGM